MHVRYALEVFAKLNYAAAWPSVVRNGSAFPFQWPLGSGLCLFRRVINKQIAGGKTAYGSKGVAHQVVAHALTERQSHSSQQTAKPQRNLIFARGSLACRV
jgi:hypothetical protein